MRYFVEIHRTGNRYTGSIHQGDPDKARSLPELQLGPDAVITIKGQSYPLGNLIKALVEYDSKDLQSAFDERGQLEIGQYLYTQLFGNLRHYEHHADEVDVRIIAQDEQISRLPWVLLADQGIFLATTGWSVALSSRRALCDCCELPPSPRMLIVAPQPVHVPATNAEAHLEQLENLLSAADHHFRLGRNLRVADTWEEFRELVEQFEPQIVYYYGHGEGNIHKVRLLFATGAQQICREVPIADFALCLRKMEPTPALSQADSGLTGITPPYPPQGGNFPYPPQGGKWPRLVYVNCCSGDAGGFLGVGRQLEDFVPAVITNRTVARIDAAQAQALAFWDSVLLKGIAPHKAIATLYSRMGDLGLSVADVRWMTPVLHCRYDKWRANPPKPPGRLEHDPYWHVKVDRVVQFSIVAEQTRQMLRERKPHSLAFIWYGEQGQGVELFHQRLKVEFQESLTNTFVDEVRPEWPMELSNYDRSFRDMLIEAFEVNCLEDIPARIRSKTYGATGKQALVYVRHQPVTSSKLINPKTLKTYLEWWNSEFVHLLERQQFALLGVSFVVQNPPKFRASILNKERLEDLYLDETIFRLLDEMERVARRDLLDFLRTHNIRLPIKRRDQVLERILERTGGHYEKTVEELKNLVEQAWDLREEEEQAVEQVEEEYDY